MLPKREIQEKQVYSLNEICELLRISRNTALKLILRRELPAIKVGKQYRILGENLLFFLRKPLRRLAWEEKLERLISRSRDEFREFLKASGYDADELNEEDVERIINEE